MGSAASAEERAYPPARAPASGTGRFPRDRGHPPRFARDPHREADGPPRHREDRPRDPILPPSEPDGSPRLLRLRELSARHPPRETDGSPPEVGGPPREPGHSPRGADRPQREAGASPPGASSRTIGEDLVLAPPAPGGVALAHGRAAGSDNPHHHGTDRLAPPTPSERRSLSTSATSELIGRPGSLRTAETRTHRRRGWRPIKEGLGV